MENKKDKKIMILLVVLLIIGIAGIVIAYSFAYFTASVVNKTTPTESVVTTGEMEIEFTDGPEVGLENALPGMSVTKTFKVKNTGTVDTMYDIYLSDLVNTFADKTDLVYTLISLDGGYNIVTETEVPSESSKIVSNKEIEVGKEHNYQLVIKFKETNDNQDDNKNKKFTTVIRINEVKDGPKTYYIAYHPYDTEINYAYNESVKDTGVMPLQTLTTGSKYKLAKNTFTRPYYTFKGWSTTEHSQVVTYVDEAEVEDLTTTNGETIDLYPVWEANISSVSDLPNLMGRKNEPYFNRSLYIDPDNYVTFAGETAGWRIVRIVNNTIEIIRNESIGKYAWDSAGTAETWKDSTLKATLDGLTQYTSPSIVSEYNYNISSDGYAINNSVKSRIGLMEWLPMQTYSQTGDILDKDYYCNYWSMAFATKQQTGPSSYDMKALAVTNSNNLKLTSELMDVYPVVHLKSGLNISGTGRQDNPFVFSE